MSSIISSRRALLLSTMAALTAACSDAPTAIPPFTHRAPGPNAALGPKPAQGRIAYASSVSGEWHIYVYDHASLTTKRLTDNPGGGNTEPSLSPDGKRVVWTRFEAGVHLYAINTDGTKLERLTTNPEPNLSNPSFSPDMKKVLVRANNVSTGVSQLHLFDLKTRTFIGLGDPTKQTLDGDWSPDGKRIAYIAPNGVVNVVFTMNADGTNVQEIVKACPAASFCASPRWSPDGGRIAFEVSGAAPNIWVYRFDTDASQLQVIDGRGPMWSPDGTRLGFHRETVVPAEATMYTTMYPVTGQPEALLAGLESLAGTDWGK